MGAFDDAHQALSVAIEAGASRSESGSDLRMSADNEVVARVYLARALWSLGRLDESSDHALAAIERARSLGQAMTIAVERVALGLMRLPGIDTKAALARADDTISLCVEHRFAYLEQSARFNFGALISLEGDVRRGLGIMDEAFQNAERMQTQLVRPMRLGLMAAARARLGETEMALRLIAEAMHQVNKTEERQFESGLFRIKGTMLIKAKQFDAATAALERSIDIAQRQGALSDELHTARLLAQLFAKSGRLEDAWALLEPRCRAFTQGADDPEVLQARAALAGLVQGRPVMSDRSTAI